MSVLEVHYFFQTAWFLKIGTLIFLNKVKRICYICSKELLIIASLTQISLSFLNTRTYSLMLPALTIQKSLHVHAKITVVLKIVLISFPSIQKPYLPSCIFSSLGQLVALCLWATSPTITFHQIKYKLTNIPTGKATSHFISNYS